jgi:hypothetical protein
MFARLRTISEIMGKPPIPATSELPRPTASRSRLGSCFRFRGSIRSTALALSTDSKVPISANITIHLMPVGVATPLKSGYMIADAILLGTATRSLSLTS